MSPIPNQKKIYFKRKFLISKEHYLNLIYNLSQSKTSRAKFIEILKYIYRTISTFYGPLKYLKTKYFIPYVIIWFLSPIIVLFIRVITPIYLIRFGRICYWAFGATVLAAENYLTFKINSPTNTIGIDLFYYDGLKGSNVYLSKIIKKTILGSPLLGPLYYFNALFPGGKRNEIPSVPFYSERDIVGNWNSTKCQLFKQENIFNDKNNIISAIKTKNRPYICFYMREEGFRNTKANSNLLAKYEDYVFLINYLIKKGYTVVKMGKAVNECIDNNNSYFIDYAGKYHEDHLDIWLCSNCSFFINISTGGLTTLPLVFRKPVLCLDYDIFTFWSSYKNVLTGFKKILKKDKVLNLSEILINLDNKLYGNIYEFEKEGYKFQNQNKDEVISMADQMIQYDNLKWSETPEIIDLKHKFWEVLKKWNNFDVWHGNSLRGSIGEVFLKNNSFWLTK